VGTDTLRGQLTAWDADGSFTYEPSGQFEWLAEGQETTDEFSYTVSDGRGGEATATVTVTVTGVNDAPQLVVVGNREIVEGDRLSINDIGTFTDLDYSPDTTLRYTIDWSDGAEVDAGTATIDQPGGEAMPTAGSFDGTHIYADDGVYTVTVTIRDDDGGIALQQFEVTVDNIAPTLDALPNVTADEGAMIQLPAATFSDQGFNNPLGSTEESFTATIDWGDGTVEPTGDITLTVEAVVHDPPVVLMPEDQEVILYVRLDKETAEGIPMQFGANGLQLDTFVVFSPSGGLITDPAPAAAPFEFLLHTDPFAIVVVNLARPALDYTAGPELVDIGIMAQSGTTDLAASYMWVTGPNNSASSAEFVGEFWLREVSKVVV